MTIKFDSSADALLRKASVISAGDTSMLESMTEGVIQRGILKPRLLTAMLQPELTFENSNSFRFDTEDTTAQLPSGKAFGEKGKDLEKDQHKTFSYVIGSRGLRWNVAPSDFVRRRMPGTSNEFMTAAYAASKMQLKTMDAWDLDAEIGIAQLLTTDTNYTAGGPAPVYNFFTEIAGETRASYQGAAKVDMLLAAAPNPVDDLRTQRKLGEQELAKAGLSATGWALICGDVIFGKYLEIERNEGLNRDLRTAVDLASMQVPTVTDGLYRYDNFTAQAGVEIINYGSQILAGGKLIADDDAYLVPVGVSFMKIAHAPSETMTYANQPALAMYMWSGVDEFKGITNVSESNRFYFNPLPRVIRALTSST